MLNPVLLLKPECLSCWGTWAATNEGNNTGGLDARASHRFYSVEPRTIRSTKRAHRRPNILRGRKTRCRPSPSNLESEGSRLEERSPTRRAPSSNQRRRRTPSSRASTGSRRQDRLAARRREAREGRSSRKRRWRLGRMQPERRPQDKRQQQQANSNAVRMHEPGGWGLQRRVVVAVIDSRTWQSRTLICATFRTVFDFYASESRSGCSASKRRRTCDGGSET